MPLPKRYSPPLDFARLGLMPGFRFYYWSELHQQYVSLARGPEPDRRYHGATPPEECWKIKPPPSGPYDRFEEAYYPSADGLFWRATAAGGAGHDRFWLHFWQGLGIGLLMGNPLTARAGCQLLDSAYRYQDSESKDIMDKGWWDMRGLSTGAHIGSAISGTATMAVLGAGAYFLGRML